MNKQDSWSPYILTHSILVAEMKSQTKKSKEYHRIMMLVWETLSSCHPPTISVFSYLVNYNLLNFPSHRKSLQWFCNISQTIRNQYKETKKRKKKRNVTKKRKCIFSFSHFNPRFYFPWEKETLLQFMSLKRQKPIGIRWLSN